VVLALWTEEEGEKGFISSRHRDANPSHTKLTAVVSAGCLGMSVGEVRKLDIPADEGYGANGSPTLAAAGASLPAFFVRASCDPSN
jgi:FKBP-type peptidyl-prolyl cis-trans isomerase